MIKLFAENGIIIDDEVLATSFEKNIIFSVNVKTGELKYKGFIPEESFELGRLSGSIQRWNDKFIFAPFKAKSLWIADLEFQNWEAIDLDFSIVKASRFFFWGSVLVGDDLYLGGWNFGGFFKLNLKTKDYKYIEYNNSEPFSTCYELPLIDGKIYSPILGTSNIVVLNTENDGLAVISLDNPNYRIVSMKKKDELLWIVLAGTDEIISVDPKDMTVHDRISLGGQVAQTMGLVLTNDVLLAYSRLGNSFAYSISEKKQIHLDDLRIYWAKEYGSSVIYATETGYTILNPNEERKINVCIEAQSSFAESLKKRMIEEDISHRDMFKENEIVNLEFLIRLLDF